MKYLYDAFFDDLKLFLEKYNLSKHGEVKGMSDSEINEIESLLCKKVGLALQSYFSHFGKKITVKGKGSMLLNFTKKGLLYAHKESLLYDRNIYAEISNIQYLEQNETLKLSKKLDKVIMLNYDEIGHCFTLMEAEEDNPFVYHYYGLGDLVSSNSRFIEYIRWAVFSRIKNVLRLGDLSANSTNNVNSLMELDWVRFYISKLEDMTFWFRYNENRATFHQMMYESGETENRVFSFNDWENMLIEYL